MTIFEFFALFSFSFIVFIIVSTFILGFIASRKKKKVVKELNALEEHVIGLHNSDIDFRGVKHEIEENN